MIRPDPVDLEYALLLKVERRSRQVSRGGVRRSDSALTNFCR